MKHILALSILSLAFVSPAFAQSEDCILEADLAVIPNGEISLGNNAGANGQGAIAIGQNAKTDMGIYVGPGNIAIGEWASSVGGTGSTAIGGSANAIGDDTTATGGMAKAGDCFATATGASAEATGRSSTATGHFTKATHRGATTTGAGSQATEEGATTNGAYARSTAKNSTALGTSARATHENSVALGAGTQTTRENEVHVGNRQIGGVRDGTLDTDAVNLRQMNEGDQWAVRQSNNYTNWKVGELEGRINSVGAMGSAMAMMTGTAAAIPKTNKVAVGVGNYNGKTAFAVGYQRSWKTKNDRPLAFTLGASFTGSDSSVGAGLGMGF